MAVRCPALFDTRAEHQGTPPVGAAEVQGLILRKILIIEEVLNSNYAIRVSVSESVLALILTLGHRIIPVDQIMRDGGQIINRGLDVLVGLFRNPAIRSII